LAQNVCVIVLAVVLSLAHPVYTVDGDDADVTAAATNRQITRVRELVTVAAVTTIDQCGWSHMILEPAVERRTWMPRVKAVGPSSLKMAPAVAANPGLFTAQL
jgi:hypothetical protein